MHQTDPHATIVQALRKITRARQLLEDVVTSSESFDYPKAKQGLKDLQQMIRELGREEARLRAGGGFQPGTGAQVLPFPGPQPSSISRP